MKQGFRRYAAAAFAALLLAGCTGQGAQEAAGQAAGALGAETVTETSTQAGTETPAEAGAGQESAAKAPAVAGEGETIAQETLAGADMTPVRAADLKDGTYEVTAESSSSMFPVTKCELTVADGKMSAVLTMGGRGYTYVFMGKGADAVDESRFIPYGEDEDGAHTFTVPVEALDEELPCAAFSTKKAKWYDRTLLFRADSLPADAFVKSRYATAESLGLADGEYQVEVAISGGSGRASVESPAKLTVRDGSATARIVWGSSNYDYMVVEGERYEPANADGNSMFEIPVTGFDYPVTVYADTTAMSVPHEIEYTLTFDSSSIR